MQRAPNNNSNPRVFYNRTVTPSDVVTVERQFHNTHLSSGQNGYARRGRQNQHHFPPNFPFVVAPDVDTAPSRRGPRQNHATGDSASQPQIHASHHASGPNPNWRRNRQNQQHGFPPNFPFVPATDDWQYKGPRRNYQQQSGQPSASGPNQRGNWRGNRQHNPSNRGNNKNATRYSHSSKSSSTYHGGHSQGSSSCSSDSVQPQVVLPIEEHEREAVEIIKETIKIIKEEKDLYYRRSKALRKPRPHYECLEGAMIRREQIQHESYEKHGDRHEIDDHEVIYGHKKEYVDMLRERRIHISKWLLNNRVEAQVEYDCDVDAEPLQISDEETELKAQESREEEKSEPAPA